ncbi:hypothetical protein PR048_026216 [Dryococelus australis]|uniref:Uncharacterized protein n=1 Tax=Dryococelus australis TaxID=614101 RepID=A0ABQ9GKQ2_9NEOP|nr:hypothetical protein PR048_026216 [Dryococelus australis]
MLSRGVTDRCLYRTLLLASAKWRVIRSGRVLGRGGQYKRVSCGIFRCPIYPPAAYCTCILFLQTRTRNSFMSRRLANYYYSRRNRAPFTSAGRQNSANRTRCLLRHCSTTTTTAPPCSCSLYREPPTGDDKREGLTASNRSCNVFRSRVLQNNRWQQSGFKSRNVGCTNATRERTSERPWRRPVTSRGPLEERTIPQKRIDRSRLTLFPQVVIRILLHWLPFDRECVSANQRTANPGSNHSAEFSSATLPLNSQDPHKKIKWHNALDTRQTVLLRKMDFLGAFINTTRCFEMLHEPPDTVSLLASHQGDPGSIPDLATPDSRTWKSFRTMSLVGGFSRGSPVSPALPLRRCSMLTSLTLIGSQDLGVKSHPNLFTHSLYESWDVLINSILIGSQDLGVKSHPNLFTHSLYESWDWVFSGYCHSPTNLISPSPGVKTSADKGRRNLSFARALLIFAERLVLSASGRDGGNLPTVRHMVDVLTYRFLKPNSAHRPRTDSITHRADRAKHVTALGNSLEQVSEQLQAWGRFAVGSLTGGHNLRQGVIRLLRALALGATVAEQLACSPSTKAIQVQSPAGSLRIFACGNRAGRCRRSTGISRFPCPFIPVLLYTHLNHPHRLSRPPC